jgi:ATP-dependent Zn protease
MGPTLGDLFIAILPMLLLIGAWFLFMRRFAGPERSALPASAATRPCC